MTASHIEHHSHHHEKMPVKGISWSAIVIGALIGIGLAFLLNLFSVAIGLSAFSVTQNGMPTLAIGGLIGILFGSLVSMFIMGWAAGYMASPYAVSAWYGILHGFAAWCLALVVSIFFAAHIGQYVTAHSNFITSPSIETMQVKPVAPIETPQGAVQLRPDNATPIFRLAPFIVFVIFFVGAFAASWGGYSGHWGRRDEMHLNV